MLFNKKNIANINLIVTHDYDVVHIESAWCSVFLIMTAS